MQAALRGSRDAYASYCPLGAYDARLTLTPTLSHTLTLTLALTLTPTLTLTLTLARRV